MSVLHIDTTTGQWLPGSQPITSAEGYTVAASVLPGVTPGQVEAFYDALWAEVDQADADRHELPEEGSPIPDHSHHRGSAPASVRLDAVRLYADRLATQRGFVRVSEVADGLRALTEGRAVRMPVPRMPQRGDRMTVTLPREDVPGPEQRVREFLDNRVTYNDDDEVAVAPGVILTASDLRDVLNELASYRAAVERVEAALEAPPHPGVSLRSRLRAALAPREGE